MFHSTFERQRAAWIMTSLIMLVLIGCAPAAKPVAPEIAQTTLTPRPSRTPSVTPSLTPAATPTILIPIVPATSKEPCLLVTRTPPPQAPTLVALDGTINVVDPHIAFCASQTTVAVGQVLTLTGLAVDIGLPYYSVMVQDSSAAQPVELARITYNQESKIFGQASQLVQVISLTADMKHIEVILRPLKSGTIPIWITATGEIHYPNGAMWAGGGSDPLTLTITP